MGLAANIVVLVVVGLAGVSAMRVTSGVRAPQYVCTETFKAGLTSFFTEKDTKPAFAEDTAELCEMCAKVMRMAYLFSNDVQTAEKWPAALRTQACSFVSDARKRDCSALTAAVITSKQSFFDSKSAKFTRKELRGTTEQLGLLVDTRSYFACKQVGCCPAVPKHVGKKVTQKPCTKPGDTASVSADRAALTKDRFYLDKLREQLFVQRRDNNEFKVKLDVHEIDLRSRETKLKADLTKLQSDQTKLAEATNALSRREQRVKRREDTEREMRAFNKKKEAWLKERDKQVEDREDVCYKREEQLGIPHPPAHRPPPIPDAPPKPPARPPTSA
jgi:hypothetical protein